MRRSESGHCPGQFERDGDYEPWVFENVAGLRLSGIVVPEEFGGIASDYVSYALARAKQFTSGKIASLAMVLAITDPAAGKNGITAFLVPTDRKGYVVEKAEHKLGQGASDTCAPRVENLFVEDELVLGSVGQGYLIVRVSPVCSGGGEATAMAFELI